MASNKNDTPTDSKGAEAGTPASRDCRGPMLAALAERLEQRRTCIASLIEAMKKMDELVDRDRPPTSSVDTLSAREAEVIFPKDHEPRPDDVDDTMATIATEIASLMRNEKIILVAECMYGGQDPAIVLAAMDQMLTIELAPPSDN